MHIKAWMLAAALTLGPAVAAHADGSLLDRAHQRLGQGVALVVQGRHAEAEKPLRQALRDDPELREAHYNLGVALRAQGRFDEAVAEYDRALALTAADDEPARARCLYGAALAREARGDHDAWDRYLAYARPFRAERPSVEVALAHRDALNGVKVPGGAQKAAR